MFLRWSLNAGFSVFSCVCKNIPCSSNLTELDIIVRIIGEDIMEKKLNAGAENRKKHKLQINTSNHETSNGHVLITVPLRI